LLRKQRKTLGGSFILPHPVYLAVDRQSKDTKTRRWALPVMAAVRQLLHLTLNL